MRRYSRLSVAALLVVLLPLSLSAQRITRRVFVRAVSGDGAPVLNLTAADFRVTENDAPREVTRAALGRAPMRIVLLVDSSTSMAPMVNSFRAALNIFFDALPAQHEVAFITTGGQLRVRTSPTTDRLQLKREAGLLASAGGANAFLDTLLEADKRFLQTAPGQWPVFVIVTTDKGEMNREVNLDPYNKFMNDFVARGGSAHAVILVGKQVGLVTDLVLNLVQNVAGTQASINTDYSLADRLRAIAEQLAADHQAMVNRYEVDFTGDAKLSQPFVNVLVTRDDVQVQMSPRRPF
ncbi:MAG: VWA domain-containing protein [Vicinamibacterales bacterium]